MVRALLFFAPILALSQASSWIPRVSPASACSVEGFGGDLVDLAHRADVVVTGTATAGGRRLEAQQVIWPPTGLTSVGEVSVPRDPCSTDDSALADGTRYLLFLRGPRHGAYWGFPQTVYPMAGTQPTIVRDRETGQIDLVGLPESAATALVRTVFAAVRSEQGLTQRGPAECLHSIRFDTPLSKAPARSLKRLRDTYLAVFIGRIVASRPADDGRPATAYKVAVESWHSVRPCVRQPEITIEARGLRRGRLEFEHINDPFMRPGERYLLFTNSGAWNEPFRGAISEPFARFRIVDGHREAVASVWIELSTVNRLHRLTVEEALLQIAESAPTRPAATNCSGRTSS